MALALIREIVGLIREFVPKKKKKFRRVLDKIGIATVVAQGLGELHVRVRLAASKNVGVRMTASETRAMLIMLDRIEFVYE
jgi:hypothetical protein